MTAEDRSPGERDLLLSVITINRNNAAGLCSTAASMSASIDGRVEHVVIDGASTDDSLAALAKVDSGAVVRQVVSEPDRGIYDAMNKGLLIARGDFVVFMNSGDRFATEETLDNIVRRLGTQGPGAHLAVAEFLHGASSEPIGLPFSRHRLWWGTQHYNHQAMFYRRSSLVALGGFDLEAGFAADLKSALQLSVLGPIAELDVIATLYDGTGVSSPLTRFTPLVLHRFRVELLGLVGISRQVSAAYAAVQLIRRQGLRQGLGHLRARRGTAILWS